MTPSYPSAVGRKPQAAFFLDRDGTLNIDHDFVHRPEQWDWCPGAIEAVKWMNDHGFLVVVVTNQSGVARGRFSLEQVHALHAHADADLALHGARVDAWYVAPWHPKFHEGQDPALLDERKPGTALFRRAAERFGIDFGRSWMAGDKTSDLEPALALGMRPLYLATRHHAGQDREWIRRNGIPTHATLWEAVRESVIPSYL